MSNKEIEEISETTSWSKEECYRVYYLLPAKNRNGANMIGVYIHSKENNIDPKEAISDLKTVLI